MGSNDPSAGTADRFALVIPVYNHAARVAAVVRQSLQLGLPVIVVDDGSTDETAAVLAPFRPDIRLVRHRVNRGKGTALVSGFRNAALIADWALTLDADGQHDPAEARHLMAAAKAHAQRPIVVGARRQMRRARAPWTSRSGREFSNFWVRLAGGPSITDTQSGFRAYPLPEALHLHVRARRFQYEIEVLVQARRHGMPVIEVPVGVTYQAGEKRVSHFHPFFDFLRNFGVFSRLITQRVLGLGTARKGRRSWG
jgi:glycosyltransferase involved in cell wall biosynthesis